MSTNKNLKQQLFRLIKETALKNNMSQRDLSKVLNIQHPRVSNMLDERHDLFSIDQLIDFTNSLGYSVNITTEKETAS